MSIEYLKLLNKNIAFGVNVLHSTAQRTTVVYLKYNECDFLAQSLPKL